MPSTLLLPKYTLIYSRIGVLYLRLGLPDEAEFFLKKGGVDLNNLRRK